MATASEATWPTEFSDFKRLDAVLKCGICYDYMTNCMITSCSHTYCSLCIRKFMQYKNQCPACFEETYEIHLRNNRPLDEVISIFVKMKDKLQRALRLATIPIPIKEGKYETKEEADVAPRTPKNKSTFEPKTPSSVRGKTHISFTKPSGDEVSTAHGSKEKSAKPPIGSQSGDDVVLNGVKIPGIFNAPISFPKARKPEELAECPVCHVEVPARNINIHLDSCLAVESEVCQKKAKAPPKRDPLPKRLYDLMQDRALKKVLKDYGLSTQGDRRTLIGRIKRYTVIYNSENDSPNPRPVSELIAQLEREEREEKRPSTLMKSFTRQAQQQRITIDRKADPQVIEQANKTYRDENKEQFKKLIEQMRAREGKNIKPLKPPPRVYSDDEDDPNQSVSFDPAVPSTSREDPSDLYSLATQPNYDSDWDIFQDSEEKDSSKGKIDWSKTRISEKDTLVISDSEDEGEAVELVAVGSGDETRDKPDDGTDEDDHEAVEDHPEGHNSFSGDGRTGKKPVASENEPATDQLPVTGHPPGVNQPFPPTETIQNVHILLSPTAPECADCDAASADCGASDTRESLNDSSEKENDKNTAANIVESSKPKDSPRPFPFVETPALQDSEESNDSDTILERCNVDSTLNITPRTTRSSRRSAAKSHSSTPSSTSSRGTKRKSDESPGTRMVDTFDYLFEKYNGDRVNEDIDSDEDTCSDSNRPSAESEPNPATRRTRYSTRNKKPSTPEESGETNKKSTRKRAKKDLSPPF